MPRRYCANGTCGVEVVGTGTTIVVSYVASALALAAPLLNSVGSGVKASLAITGVNFSFMSLIILGVWFLSGLIAAHERYTNVLLCVIGALGMPGLLLAVMAIGSLQ